MTIMQYIHDMPAAEHRLLLIQKYSFGLLLCFALYSPLQLLGAESVVPQPEQNTSQAASSVSQTPSVLPLDTLDAPRNYLSGKLVSFANNIDHFFGNDRNYQESNQSVFQLDLTRVTGYGGDDKFDLAGRVNLRLPSTEGRLHLLLETNPENNITTESTQGQTVLRNQVVAPASYALAARYANAVQDIWHFSMDSGVKFRGITKDPNPFVRSRGSYSAPLGKWRMKAAETVFWFKTIGAGESSQLDFEHFINEPTLFRATTNATWLNDKQNFDLRQDLSIYNTVNDSTALLYQASVVGVSNPQYQVSEYVLLLNYRYRVHRDWLFFELSPQLHFPKTENFQSKSSLMMRLEMLFDGSR